MAPRLWEKKRKLKKCTILTRKPGSHVRILIYRTWPIGRPRTIFNLDPKASEPSWSIDISNVAYSSPVNIYIRIMGCQKGQRRYKPEYQARETKSSTWGYLSKPCFFIFTLAVFARCSPTNWTEEASQNLNGQYSVSIGHFRNVRGLGKSMVVFRLFEKLWYSNERSTIF